MHAFLSLLPAGEKSPTAKRSLQSAMPGGGWVEEKERGALQARGMGRGGRWARREPAVLGFRDGDLAWGVGEESVRRPVVQPALRPVTGQEEEPRL